MEVVLKRHPVFRNEYDEYSVIKDNTELMALVKDFEELSRNYTGVEFKENIFKEILGGGKKIRIRTEK